MAKGSAGLVLTAGAGVAAVVAGVWTLWGQGEAPPVAQEPAALVASPAETPAAPEASLPPEAPRFDVVRVDAGGLATVAGTSQPGGSVALRLDGAEVSRLAADGSGQFATVLTLPPSEVPRMLSLALILPDGSEVAGQETVALAPVAAPEVAVAEAPAPAALLVTEEGVEVLQSGATAEAPALPISIDSIAYGAAGEVLLGGKATPAATLRIYLDEAPQVDAVADAEGKWQARLDDVAAGLHSLRADEIGADGKVLSRFETPFQRDLPEAIAVAEAPAVETPVAEAPPAEAPAAAAPATETAVAEAAPAKTPVAETSVTEAPAAEAPAAAVPIAETPVAETAVAAAETAQTPAPAAADPLPEVAPAPVTITVQPGFTLWAIAKENFGEGVMYVQVFEANRDKIKDPDLIYPGQVFTVPKP